MSSVTIAAPRPGAEDGTYHRASADSCSTDNYIVTTVEEAYFERGLRPCDDCSPPVPEGEDEDERANSDASITSDTGPKDSLGDANWGGGKTTPGPKKTQERGEDVSQGDDEISTQTEIEDNITTAASPSGETDSNPTAESDLDSDTISQNLNRNENYDAGALQGNSGDDYEDTDVDALDSDEETGLKNVLQEETEDALAVQTANGDAPSPHLSDRVPPEEADTSNEGLLGIPNRTQDLARFEYVLDEDDDIGAENVNYAGMVSVGNGEYVAIGKVRPREWSVLKDGDKQQVIQSYKSAFLSPLDSPVEIVEYPSEFDISDHLWKVEQVRKENENKPSSHPLIQAGRRVYPKWLRGFINRNGMKQRKFYMIVKISEDQINQFEQSESSVFGRLRKQSPLIDGMVGRILREEEDETETREKCLRELDTRFSRLESGLRRFNVQAERLDDRDEVMKVLYEYYNDSNPRVDAFETSQYTTAGQSQPNGKTKTTLQNDRNI